MRASQFYEYGGPEVLSVVDVDKPHARASQVRIAVHAAGVNQIDWKIRAGLLQGRFLLLLPAGAGTDAAGIVDEVGDGVPDVEIGDRVFGSGFATSAEYAVLNSWAAMPERLSFEEAAGYPLPVEAAVRIFRQVGVSSGQTLLVSGATGGVGSAVVQIARARGVTVIGTASSPKQKYLRSLGAIPIIYGDGLVDRVREVTSDGVDAALDIAGSGIIPELVDLTGDPSKVLSIADFSAPEYGAQVSAQSTNPSAAFRVAVHLFDAGLFGLPIEKTFSLEEVGDAQALSQAGHVSGRLIITILEPVPRPKDVPLAVHGPCRRSDAPTAISQRMQGLSGRGQRVHHMPGGGCGADDYGMAERRAGAPVRACVVIEPDMGLTGLRGPVSA